MSDAAKLREAQDELRACADQSHSLDQLMLFVHQWLQDWETDELWEDAVEGTDA